MLTQQINRDDNAKGQQQQERTKRSKHMEKRIAWNSGCKKANRFNFSAHTQNQQIACTSSGVVVYYDFIS